MLVQQPRSQAVPTPVFDHLQYANMEGEGLGDLVTCSYVRWTEGRQMGGGAQL